MSDGEILLWESRLGGTPITADPKAISEPNERSAATSTATGPSTTFEATPPDSRPAEHPLVSPPVMSAVEAGRIIQNVAGSFARVSRVDAFAEKAEDAVQLLQATEVRTSAVPRDIVMAVREVVRLAVAFDDGVDEQQAIVLAGQMKDQVAALQGRDQDLPYELDGLVRACERVAQTLTAQVKDVAGLSITPPSALKVAFDRPAPGETLGTLVVARLANPGPESASDVKVVFTSPSPGVHFAQGGVSVPTIGPGEKLIAENAVELTDEVENEVDVRVHVTCEIGGVPRPTRASGPVPVRLLGDSIPATLRYVTGAPVRAHRTDLFHGRDKELEDLHSLLEFPAEEIAAQLEADAEEAEKVLPRVMSFVVTPQQEELIEMAVEAASDGTAGRDRKARGLTNLARRFLEDDGEAA